MSRRVSLPLIFLVLVLTGCNSGVSTQPVETSPRPERSANSEEASENEGAQATGDPCRFVTEAEAESAVGAEVETTNKTETGCGYDNLESGTLLSTNFIPRSGKALFESERKNAEEVQGIGDGALYFPGQGMIVLKGDAALDIQIPGLDDDEAALRSAVEQLARTAAGRM